ncbi:hypothetical protein N781_16880 [Pontibacillus halophilus JSM 076056 = DSM 19796]|uniref:Uncharacterized protein n=1 Tax=Pontibacillus halophilus JSM 076056 = DSM 19796 TaxID=1385510 RepID=A0A0A5GN01_9BACI|nr:hypothetical protein [Pontibacillus halophilus]KGX92510.1 hypothetical protein N781_16880 [Pontibacillus halophilus JSM 076056 = DSM 19796]
MNRTMRSLIGLIGSLVLIVASSFILLTKDIPSQTTTVQTIFLVSGVVGVITNGIIIKKLKA